jgi:amidohydrolase
MFMDSAELKRLADFVAGWATECRHHLHQHPELSFYEKDTSKFIFTELASMGYTPVDGIGGYGIKAVLSGTRGPGRTIALRADVDALPINEETELPFASSKPGVMHACGHDIHTAILLGTAKALRELQPVLAGQVVLIFQPAEETPPGGAAPMIDDGVLEDPHVDAIFGLHVLPTMTVGKMSLGTGALLASPTWFDITILGQGGHGGHPDLTVDAVYVASQAVLALQAIVSRNSSPFDPAVLSVGSFHAGTKHNIIAGEAKLQGTVRTMSETARSKIVRRIDEVISGICRANGASYTLSQSSGYPVLINTEAETNIAKAAADFVLGPEQVEEMEPSMGAEDFSVYLQQRPGSLAKIGCATPGEETKFGLHSPYLVVDERVIPLGISYYLSLVQKYLK